MEVKGKIVAALPLQTGQGRNGEWKKQDYVLEYNLDSQYPKKMMFNLWGDKIEQYQIKEGQLLKIDFDIDCREFNGRWFNDIRAWRIEPLQSETVAPATTVMPNTPPVFESAPLAAEDSDLPF
ncbi:MAG: DUF3127 domain-containing protein [Prevotellaceae bacterium]|jgi:hypothetical protein|nr:DUF3127 domain-containing protein [Prevotellaceae bacterium]